MAAPNLIFAGAIGQGSIRAIFDQPMLQSGPTTPEDPSNPANWSVGGGLPTVVSVNVLSIMEYELILASPAPLAAGYSVTVAATVTNSATPAEGMDPAGVTSPLFAVTVPDLTVTTAWTSPTTLDLVFSENIADITFSEFKDVIAIRAQDVGSREPAISGFVLSGTTVTVTFAAACTSGARYEVQLVRENYLSLANGTLLLSGEENQLVWGQGDSPIMAGLSLYGDQAEVTSSEVLGIFPTATWPLSHSLYAVSAGDLGTSTPLELGSSPSILVAPGATLPVGDNVTLSLNTLPRAVTTGVSLTGQASSVVGSGTETVGVGTTTLNKVAGAPFELVYSGGNDSFGRAGRRLTTNLDISFTPGLTSFPLLVFTLLNTQASIVLEKQTDDTAIWRIYRGSLELPYVSAPFDPTVPFALALTDATSEGGFLSIEVDGVTVLGAPSTAILDDILIKNNVGATAIAVVLGSPAAPAEVFSIEFLTDLLVETYLANGFIGTDSRDLFSFTSNSLTAVVGIPLSGVTSGGYEDTGKPAFSVYAELLSNLNGEFLTAIQVVIAFNPVALSRQHTGVLTLLTADEKPMDQMLFDQSYIAIGGDTINAIFTNPKCWSGALVNVNITIDGTDYSTAVPITEIGAPIITAYLSPQPANWYHARLSNALEGTNLADFGPASVINTP